MVNDPQVRDDRDRRARKVISDVRAMTTDYAEKERVRREVDDAIRKREPRPRRYALQTPSGNIIGMGLEKPLLSRQDKRLGWRVIPLGVR